MAENHDGNRDQKISILLFNSFSFQANFKFHLKCCDSVAGKNRSVDEDLH